VATNKVQRKGTAYPPSQDQKGKKWFLGRGAKKREGEERGDGTIEHTGKKTKEEISHTKASVGEKTEKAREGKHET